jgi:hypothetical protein
MTLQEIINDIIDKFQSASTDLLSITNRDVMKVNINNNEVFFGKVYAKPSKRLSRLLTIENEFLILISTFKDQQFRTVAQAKDIIESSGGRLEPTVTIIIHRDNFGDARLKKWGRQKSISVLPLFYDDIGFPKAEKLENHLLSELFSNDPFDVTGPVSDDSQFYGRRTEAIDLSRKLSNGQIRSCLGIRKIGKTSLLNRVLIELSKQGEAKSVIIDCSKDYIWQMTAGKLMTAIAIAIDTAINSQQKQTIISDVQEDSNINSATTRILNSINSFNKPVILFFDEIDYITPSSPTSKVWVNDFNVFWRNLRAVYQDVCRFNHNLGLFISGVTSKWFSIESINGIENAALAFVPEEYLSPLPKGASEQMIKILARTSGLQFDDKIAALISDFCSDIPYWIRKACSYIHRNVPFEKRPYRPEISEIQKLLEQFLISDGGVLSRVALMHLTKVYPELKNPILQINKNEASTLSKLTVSTLEKYGVAKSIGGIRIAGELMREGVNLISHFAEEEIVPDLEAQVSDKESYRKIKFDNYDEWADELAILNRDRNLVEKKLRNIVVNFLRVDCLTNKTKGNVLDRLLKIIPSDKRNVFNNLSPEDAINKFLWTDLYKIIDKEWHVFEKLFIDKNQFMLNATIINERSDAHAKDADIADIAIQRKGIKWFEDKIRMI